MNSRHDDRIMRLSREFVRDQDRDGMRRLFEAAMAAIPPSRYQRVLEIVVMMVSNDDWSRSAKLTEMLDGARGDGL